MVDAINQAYDAKPHLLVEYLINNPQVFWQLVSDGQTFEAYEAKSHPRPYWPPTVVVFALLRCCLYLVVVAAMAYIATLDAVPHAGSITAVVLTEPSHFHVNIMQDVLLGMHQFARTILGYTGIPVDNAIVVGLTGVGSLGACAGSFSLERAWERSRSRIGEEDWARLAVVLARWRTDEDLWLNCDEQPTPLASLPNTVSGADLDVAPGAGGTPGGTAESSSRERRIAEVHAAVTHLDAEWLAYTLDTNAYFLAKPILRDPSVPQTAAYLDALYELRELANQLESTAEETQIAAAHDAADRALYAWEAANDHAAEVGVSDRSPIERAALRRLPKLIARLADPGTARAEWGLIKAAIDNELAHLVTVPAKWEHIAKLPEIEASRQLLALEQALPRETPL
ncbi:hypothetical protein [Mycobacteroides abscessus]|uniref:hypothetical protein n=1 Tax=Mycobacteroides abscessus TaxID=36809 RepID=UPI00130006EB|nr:hypothetical protein [Mycobacteroides abscessus]